MTGAGQSQHRVWRTYRTSALMRPSTLAAVTVQHSTVKLTYVSLWLDGKRLYSGRTEYSLHRKQPDVIAPGRRITPKCELFGADHGSLLHMADLAKRIITPWISLSNAIQPTVFGTPQPQHGSLLANFPGSQMDLQTLRIDRQILGPVSVRTMSITVG